MQIVIYADDIITGTLGATSMLGMVHRLSRRVWKQRQWDTISI